MTLPYERFRAVEEAKEFLTDLLDPKLTPRVPKHIREQAYFLLRHYPRKYDMDMVATKCPDVFETDDPIDNLSMLIHDYEQGKNNGSTN